MAGVGVGNAVSCDRTGGSDTVQFLWGSERSGYQHLYLYSVSLAAVAAASAHASASGATAGAAVATLVRQVTGGYFQVKAVVSVDADNGYVYFSANVGSPTNTHL